MDVPPRFSVSLVVPSLGFLPGLFSHCTGVRIGQTLDLSLFAALRMSVSFLSSRNLKAMGASSPATLQTSSPFRLFSQLGAWVLLSGIFGPLSRQWIGSGCSCECQRLWTTVNSALWWSVPETSGFPCESHVGGSTISTCFGGLGVSCQLIADNVSLQLAMRT